MRGGSVAGRVIVVLSVLHALERKAAATSRIKITKPFCMLISVPHPALLRRPVSCAWGRESTTTEWRETFKLGDARPLICSLVGWRLSRCPPFYTCYDQYITNLKHPLTVGAVQTDFYSILMRPVQARVRQARVLRPAPLVSVRSIYLLYSPIPLPTADMLPVRGTAFSRQSFCFLSFRPALTSVAPSGSQTFSAASKQLSVL